MNMTSACFIKLMTNVVFPEHEGPPTIHVNGCFHFSTSSHGSDVRPHIQCVFAHVVLIYEAILRLQLCFIGSRLNKIIFPYDK